MTASESTRAICRLPTAGSRFRNRHPGPRSLEDATASLDAVWGINLDIRDGEIFGLIGPDGAGKTTTFQILAGVMEATSGTAEVFGVPAREARSHTGYLTQAFSLYPDLTVARKHPLHRRSPPRAARGDHEARTPLPAHVRHGPLRATAGRTPQRRHETEAGAGLRAGAGAARAAARRAHHGRRSRLAPRVLGYARAPCSGWPDDRSGHALSRRSRALQPRRADASGRNPSDRARLPSLRTACMPAGWRFTPRTWVGRNRCFPRSPARTRRLSMSSDSATDWTSSRTSLTTRSV